MSDLNLGTVYASFELRMGTIESQIKKFETDFARLGDRTKKQTENMGRAFSDLGRTLSIGLTTPLLGFGAAAFKAAADMDSLKRGLTAVAGSTKEAERQMVRLKDVAKLPGLGFEEAVRGSIRLQAAGLSAQLAERSLRSFGNAIATVGGGKAELDGVTLALGQIAAKGKVFAEEINQINERVPQIRQAMKDAFGTADTEKLQKMGLSSTEFIDAITKQLGKLPEVTGGVKNAMENFSDASKQALAAVGDALLPIATNFLDKVTPAIKDAGRAFQELPDAAKNALGGLAITGILVGPALYGLGQLYELLKKIGGVLKIVGGSIVGPMAVPVVGGVAALGGVANLGYDIKNDPRAKFGDAYKMSPEDTKRRVAFLTSEIARLNRAIAMARLAPAEIARINVPKFETERAKSTSELTQLLNPQAKASLPDKPFKRKMDPKATAEAQLDILNMGNASDKLIAARREAEAERVKAITEEGVNVEVAEKRMIARIKQAEDEYAKAVQDWNDKRERLAKSAFTKSRSIGEAIAGGFGKPSGAVDKASVFQEPLGRDIENATKEFTEGIRLNAGSILQEFDDMDKKLRMDAYSNQKTWMDGWAQFGIDYANNLMQSINDASHSTNLKPTPGEPDSIDRIMGLSEDKMQWVKAGEEAARNVQEGFKRGFDSNKQLFKNLQRDLGQVLSGGFEDLFSGKKNIFQSMADAFKQALIRMAADLAASAVMNGIADLFGGGGKKGGKGGGSLLGLIPGGNVIGGALGAVGKIFGFADGGWVPGPIGAPQPAIVHGGEFVISRQMLAAGGGPISGVSKGVTFHPGSIVVHAAPGMDTRTLAREVGRELADQMDRQSSVRRGSGRR